MGGIRSPRHTFTWLDTVCSESGRYIMYCMWYILYSMHDISCAWSACKNCKIVLPSLGGGADVVDTICSASYCGCSSSPTSCILYLFGPCLLFHHPNLFVLLYYNSFPFSISIFILSYNPLFFPPSHFFLSPFHYVHVKPCQLSPSVTSSSPHIFLMSNPLFYSIIHPTSVEQLFSHHLYNFLILVCNDLSHCYIHIR